MKLKKVKNNRSIIFAIFAGSILLIGFGATFAIAIASMGKSPNNTPEKFIASPGKSLVVCIGDSITQGTVSANYVDVLSSDASLADFTFVNAGINGDLAYNALMRKDSVISLNPDYIIILLGTNDANATLSKENERMYIKDKSLPEKPTKEWFEKNLSDLIISMKTETKAKIAILSIPVIGEKLDSIEIRKTKEYSAIIKELAKNQDIDYLPLNEKQLDFLEARNHEPGTLYSPKESTELMVKNAYLHFILHEDWDAISQSRGLLLTTDTIHQNNVSSFMMSSLISAFLRNSQKSDMIN